MRKDGRAHFKGAAEGAARAWQSDCGKWELPYMDADVALAGLGEWRSALESISNPFRSLALSPSSPHSRHVSSTHSLHIP